MLDIILAIIIIVCVGLASLYIYRAKKKGKKCIGCPESGGCHCECSRKNQVESQ